MNNILCSDKYNLSLFSCQDISKELLQINNNFVNVYSCFFAITGSLTLNNDFFEKTLKIFTKTQFKTTVNLFNNANKGVNDESLALAKYREIKKSQKLILNILNSVKIKCLNFLNHTHVSIKSSNLNILNEALDNLSIFQNEIFSPCFLTTLNNCIKFLDLIFKKHKKIFYLLIKKNKNTQVIEKVFGKSYLFKKTDNLIDEKLIFQIHKDQEYIEQIMLLIKYISELNDEKLLFWLKTSFYLYKNFEI